jgi:hypothetical protein
LPALGTAAGLAWAAGHWGWAASDSGLWVVICAAAVAALSWWLAAPRARHVQWDGQQWLADGAAVRVEVMIDLPRWLLLRLRAEPGSATGGVCWTAVSAAESGPVWHGLRVALFARTPEKSSALLADLGPHV